MNGRDALKKLTQVLARVPREVIVREIDAEDGGGKLRQLSDEAVGGEGETGQLAQFAEVQRESIELVAVADGQCAKGDELEKGVWHGANDIYIGQGQGLK